MTESERKAESKLQRKADRFVQREVNYCLSQWLQFAIEAGSGVDSCPVDVDDIPYDAPCEDCHGTGFEVYLDEDGDPYELSRENEKKLTRSFCANHSDIDIGRFADSLDWPRATCGPCEGTWIAVDDSEICNECDNGRVTVDVYEWWAVSSYLAGKLEAAGEVVMGGEIWGRQGTGQAISMDGVIRGFAAELGDAWAE